MFATGRVRKGERVLAVPVSWTISAQSLRDCDHPSDLQQLYQNLATNRSFPHTAGSSAAIAIYLMVEARRPRSRFSEFLDWLSPDCPSPILWREKMQDELIGTRPAMLSLLKDIRTATKFLDEVWKQLQTRVNKQLVDGFLDTAFFDPTLGHHASVMELRYSFAILQSRMFGVDPEGNTRARQPDGRVVLIRPDGRPVPAVPSAALPPLHKILVPVNATSFANTRSIVSICPLNVPRAIGGRSVQPPSSVSIELPLRQKRFHRVSNWPKLQKRATDFSKLWAAHQPPNAT